MKLKIDDINIVADAAILKAISTTEFVGGETRFLADDFFVFSLGAVLGDHKPDNDNNGYWEKNNTVAGDYISAVADGYDFPGNNATDVSSLDNWDKFSRDTTLKTTGVRIEIKAIYDAIASPPATDDEKKIASKWFAIDKSIRDTVHNAAEQEANAKQCVDRSLVDSNSTILQTLADNIKDADADDAAQSLESISDVVAIIGQAWTLGGIWTTSSTTYLSIGENLKIGRASSYHKEGKTLKGILSMDTLVDGVATGKAECYNYTDLVAIANSEFDLPNGGWTDTESQEFDLPEGKTIRIRKKRVGGTGGNSVDTEGMMIYILVYK